MLQGHSKQQLISPLVRRIWAQDLRKSFAKTNQLEDLDRIGSYLLVFWCLLRMTRPKPTALPIRKLTQLEARNFQNSLTICELKELLSSSTRHLLGSFDQFESVSVQDLFIEQCLPGFPLSLAVFFKSVKDGLWPIQVLSSVPSPQEVLKWQQQGQRCISLLFDEDTLKEGLIDAKDPFKFALHDIEHAYHFFKNESLKKGQIGFYRRIEALIEKFSKEKFWPQPEFQTDFNYLISDMNSHCVHMTKTLHAILLKAHGDENFDSYWKELFEETAFHQVNRPGFGDQEARRIEQYFLGLR